MSVDFELTDLEKELLEAISMKRLDRLDECLAKGVGLHFIAGSFEERPLHLAAQVNFAEGILRLVESGARVDVCDHCGQTPLFHAAEKGALEATVQLLLLKADPNHVAGTGCTPIFSAVKNGFAELIDRLAFHGANVNFEVNGATPLFWAANRSHYDAAQALVRNGARVDARNAQGLTAGEVVQRKNSDFERDRLLVQFLTSAHIQVVATGGTEAAVKVMRRLTFRPK